ncbi:hypothetical protein V6R21_06780 [Limibacter armeniacum]|uniref:hypothetical protein n=1 Tax=Limibacter armeniacum TaxID=466084 RepID=UPI002FE6B291
MNINQEEKINRQDEVINYNLMLSCKRKVREARLILLAIALINVFGIFQGINGNNTVFTVIATIYVLTFAGLALLAGKKPRKSIIAGISIYIGFTLLAGAIYPPSLANGILMKIIIISALVKGYVASKDIEEIQLKLTEIEVKKQAFKQARS